MRKNKRDCFLIDTTKGKDMRRGFTLCVGFSRSWCVHNFFAAFNKLKIDLENCHLLVVDNTDIVTLKDELVKKVAIYSDAFYTTRLIKTHNKGGEELVTDTQSEFNKTKLPFIFDLQMKYIKYTTTDKMVILEDDTMPPPNSVMRLLSLLEKNPDCGVATAIATGRSWNPISKTRLGVHYIRRRKNKILERVSLDPETKGVVEVDGCGWYCCATYKHLWKRGFEGMNVFLKDIPRFALDNFQTNNIKNLGYKILADFSLWCKHMDIVQEPKENMILFWGKKQALIMADVWLPKYREYAQCVRLKEVIRPWLR